MSEIMIFVSHLCLRGVVMLMIQGCSETGESKVM